MFSISNKPNISNNTKSLLDDVSNVLKKSDIEVNKYNTLCNEYGVHTPNQLSYEKRMEFNSKLNSKEIVAENVVKTENIVEDIDAVKNNMRRIHDEVNDMIDNINDIDNIDDLEALNDPQTKLVKRISNLKNILKDKISDVENSFDEDEDEIMDDEDDNVELENDSDDNGNKTEVEINPVVGEESTSFGNIINEYKTKFSKILKD